MLGWVIAEKCLIYTKKAAMPRIPSSHAVGATLLLEPPLFLCKKLGTRIVGTGDRLLQIWRNMKKTRFMERAAARREEWRAMFSMPTNIWLEGQSEGQVRDKSDSIV